MTSPPLTCLSCHRAADTGSPRCRHHNNLTAHLMHGFPMPALNVENVPHLRARHDNERGSVLIIHQLSVGQRTPCQGINPQLYFEEWQTLTHRERRTLASLCASCPVLEQCREIAVAHQEDGFQGGMTPNQRASLRTLRGQLLANMIGSQNQHPDYQHGYFIRSGS